MTVELGQIEAPNPKLNLIFIKDGCLLLNLMQVKPFALPTEGVYLAEM